MSKCSIYEVLDAVNTVSESAILYTNIKGLKQLKDGNSFYVWTENNSKTGDIPLRIFEKDLTADDEGNAYCVDGLDVIIL